MTHPDTERTLLLLRHAKSSWADDALDDFDRPLNGRGRRDAPRIGKWLEESPWRPELVLCSSALRTRQTWAGLAKALSWEPEVSFQDRLYHAAPREILSLIRAIPDARSTVCLVGHNPGLGQSMLQLAGEAPPELWRRMREKVPTGALAVLRWSGEWGDAEAGIGTLLDFVRPRDLE